MPSLPRLLCGALALLIALAVTAQGQLVRESNTTLSLPADLPSSTGFTTANALGTLKFQAPIAVRSQPGRTDCLYVVERGGTIQRVDLTNASNPTASLFFDLASFLNTQGTPLTTDGECGFLSCEFHPGYTADGNGYLFVFYSFTQNGKLYQRVARFTVANGAVNTSTHLPLITQVDQASNHNGGDLHFGPDGYLYISVGDGGDANDTQDNARYINKNFFAAILRIDVDQKPGSLAPNASPTFAVNPGAYRIPPDNPFVGATSHNGMSFASDTVRTEIWACGLRNPFRFSFDRATGRLFVGDVGQDAYEEVDILTAGADAGWSYYEGNHKGPRGPSPAGSTYLFPIYEYAHGGSNPDFQGNVITGGVLCRSTTINELYGNYIFCDEGSGHIWALQPNGAAWTARKLGDNANIVAFGEDPRTGEVLLIDIGANQIKHLVSTGTTGLTPPALLSQTGAFSDLATLTPNSGIVSYAPNVSFWSDNALKQRWFSIPKIADKMTFAPDGVWTFPAGEVWIKHFDLETTQGDPNTKRRLETRFLVKTASDVYGITYKWRADYSDADLVPESGQDETIPVIANGVTTQQVWHYPARSECRTCHTPVGGFALSFNTRQLNRAGVYGGQTSNQISALSGAGYFTAPASGVNAMPAFAAAGDTTKSLEYRVRSYLAVNCVQCHQPGGAAVGNWDARPTTATDAANIINGALNDNGGDAASRFAVPGSTLHSMLVKRLQGNGVSRMPPLATNVVDQASVQLVSDWINNDLPARQNFADWQMAKFGSATAPSAQPAADPDADGQSNFEEYLAGTNPNDPASVFTSALSGSGGALTLSFPEIANRSYVVETSVDLQAWTLWDVPGNQPDYLSAATVKTISAAPAAAPQFFRVRIGQP